MTSVEYDNDELVIGSVSHTLPRLISDVNVIDDHAVVLLSPWTFDESEDAVRKWIETEDIPAIADGDAITEAEMRRRNVLGYDLDGRLRWVIGDPEEHGDTGTEHEFFNCLFRISDRLLARRNRLFQVASETGELLDSWPSNRVPIGDRVVELNGRLMQVLTVDEKYILRTGGDTRNIVAFDDEGKTLWESPEGRSFGHLRITDGELWTRNPIGPRRQERYQLDVDTGEIVSEDMSMA